MEAFDSFELDPDVGGVVYGLDTNCTFAKLAVAALYINQTNVSLFSH
jgi:hypothetical protein